MDIESILILAFCPVLIPMYIFTILLMFGIGGTILSGFHISKKSTTAKKEYMYFMRRAGFCCFILIAMIHAVLVLFVLGYYVWGGDYVWGGVMAGVLAVYLVLMLLYMNSKKMKENYKVIVENRIDEKASKKEIDEISIENRD